MQQAKPGTLTLLVSQYGVSQPQPIPLQAFSEAARLDSFALHAGDSQGILRGTRLDEVASLAIKGIEFTPGKLSSSQGIDQLPMVAADTAATALLKQGDTASAKVTLKDGRVLNLNAAVDAPRPRVTLIGKSVQLSTSSGSSNIQLASQDELPQDAKLTFSVRTQSPAAFAYDEKIEVAPVNKSSSATLGFDNGGITLVDAQVAVATLDPARAFGPSAFGPLQFRVIAHDATGDWQPLATLVRLPMLNDLKCPATRELACKLVRLQPVPGRLRVQQPAVRPCGTGTGRFPGKCAAGATADRWPAVRETARRPFGRQRDDAHCTAVAAVCRRSRARRRPARRCQPRRRVSGFQFRRQGSAGADSEGRPRRRSGRTGCVAATFRALDRTSFRPPVHPQRSLRRVGQQKSASRGGHRESLRAIPMRQR